MKKLKKLAYDYDPHMLLALMVLWGIALIGVYSATYREGTSILFYKQLIYMIVGWFLILVLSRMNFRALYDLAPVIYLFNLLLLILVPIFGKTVYGAKRWLDLGPVSLQPSEFFKFSLVLFSIYVLSHTKGLLSKDFLILLLSFAIPAILTLKQPDLGTAVIYIFILALALFLHGVKLRYFFLVGAGLLLLSPLLWHLLKGYQKARILAIIDPYKDYHGSGYQLIQSMIAIGSGQLWGKGLLDGTQSRLLFLPE
ncbi:MAG: FtsW/RodA/SpoVE family cell cycle protein, partial [Aquificaceae bacterium]